MVIFVNMTAINLYILAVILLALQAYFPDFKEKLKHSFFKKHNELLM